MSLVLGINHVDNNTYHGDRKYYSSSSLKLLLEDPILFHKKHIVRENEFKSVGSTAMDLGSFVHSLILEPEKTDDEFVVWETPKRGAEWMQFSAQHKSKTIISAAQNTLGRTLAKAAMKHKAAQQLLKGGEAEATFCTQLFGTNIKVRADYLNVQSNYILDVKTTSKPLTKDYLMSSIASLHYDLSAALYVDAFKKINNVESLDFYFIFVNTKDSLDVEVFKASNMLISNGRKKYKKALKILNKCLKSGIWKSETVEEIDVPFWALLPDDEEVCGE